MTEEIVPNYKFSRASYVLSLLRPQIFTDLELKKHGLKVHLRDPSSYTPIRPDLQSPGGPTSLTLGMCGKMNKENIAQFSQRDAVKFFDVKVAEFNAAFKTYEASFDEYKIKTHTYSNRIQVLEGLHADWTQIQD